MARFHIVLMTTAAFLAGSPAIAADISSSGADALRQVFERYAGKAADGKPGYVSVAVDGQSYKVTFDLQHALELIPAPALTAEVSPLVLSVTPLDDGTWKIESSAPLKFDYAAGERSGSSKYSGVSLDGIFDPAIAAFRSSTTKVATLESTSAAPNAMATIQARDFFQSATGKAGPNETTDIMMTQTMASLSETIQMQNPNPGASKSQPTISVDIKAGPNKMDGSINGLRARQLMDLWAFAVANHLPANGSVAPADVKPALQALLPVFDTMKADISMGAFAMQTQFGKGSVGNYSVHMDMSTRGPSNSINFDIRMEDITVDTVFMPEFARSLIPTKFDMNFGAKDFDFNSGMRTMIDGYDFAHPDPTYMTRNKDQILAGWLPTGKMIVEIPPSAVSAPAYTLGWQGSVDVTPGHAKTHIDVRIAGFDAVLKSLSQVKQAGVAQVVVGLYAAQALAKKDADGALNWAIDTEDGNNLLVNGSPVGPQKKRAL